jgi:hypothetical protein
VATGTAMNAIAWSPKEYFLAYAADDKYKDVGFVRLFGFKDKS